ncbi:MAG: hypothetical protein DRG78_15095 [Epsilonproteobacteria bacterium]|nr:MAG: hypothetical protein DRG78_15095 [Campylobacterota bacterium]
MLQDRYIREMICEDLSNDYYWSDIWDEEFYIELCKMGFISTTHQTKDGLILLPELQFDYAILDFENLHISKKVQKLMRENNYTLRFNTRLKEVIKNLDTKHKYNWFNGKYSELILSLHQKKEQFDNFEIYSVELISNETNELIAGEVGYIIGSTYTSLSGFSSSDKKYNNCGTLQLVLLAEYLQKEGFSFWNLGHPHMEYKKRLGAITHSRKEFLQRWQETIMIDREII